MINVKSRLLASLRQTAVLATVVCASDYLPLQRRWRCHELRKTSRRRAEPGGGARIELRSNPPIPRLRAVRRLSKAFPGPACPEAFAGASGRPLEAETAPDRLASGFEFERLEPPEKDYTCGCAKSTKFKRVRRPPLEPSRSAAPGRCVPTGDPPNSEKSKEGWVNATDLGTN